MQQQAERMERTPDLRSRDLMGVARGARRLGPSGQPCFFFLSVVGGGFLPSPAHRRPLDGLRRRSLALSSLT